MNELLKYTEDFDVSRPIFRLTLRSDSKVIAANTHVPQHRFTPTPIKGDVLSELVCSKYKENFSTSLGRFVINKNVIAQDAMSSIRANTSLFLEKNMEAKSARQTKLYRWYYRSMPHTVEFNVAMVMVYKYLRTFCDNKMNSIDDEHNNNAIALLTAIMEKYEES